tara:strand:- start:15 stop:740 length:726 start_codon:yes stop_codon:yes gene_type:complete
MLDLGLRLGMRRPVLDALTKALVDTLFANGERGLFYAVKPQILGEQRLWQDAERTVPVLADGDPVWVVDDLSPNAGHATAPNSAARPTYRTDGILHWLETDGIDDVFFIPNLPYAENFSVSSAQQVGQTSLWAAMRSRLTSGGFVMRSSNEFITSVGPASVAYRLNKAAFTGDTRDLRQALITPGIMTAENCEPYSGDVIIIGHTSNRPESQVFGYIEVEGLFGEHRDAVENYLQGVSHAQ